MVVGIVIPVWNLWKKMTFPCLTSVRKYTDCESIRIYLVDNGSDDETPHFAEKIGKGLFGDRHFTYIRNDENKGFAIASNQGAEAAHADGCDFVLFLNNDTLVTENWLPPLVRAMDNPKVGMVGPLLLYADNTVQHCGVVRDLNGFMLHLYCDFQRTHPLVQKKRQFKVLTGAALLVRTREFVRLGKFYEEYKNGFEDVDLGYTYYNNGFIGEIVPESIVYHLESQTPGRLDENRALHNTLVLESRNVMAAPDAHLYYHEDGLVPAYSEEFIFYPRITEEKRRSLNKTVMESYSDMLCYRMIKEEPYWHDGYYFLIESMLSQKYYEEAIECCCKLSKIFLNELVFSVYLHCMEMLNNPKRLLAAQKEVERERDKLQFYAERNKQYFNRYVSGTEWEEKLLSARKTEYIDFALLEKFKRSLRK